MISLTPPASPHRLHFRRQKLDESLVSKYDAVFALIAEDQADTLLRRMPHASLWRKLRALKKNQTALHAQTLAPAHTSMSIGLIKRDASVFSLLAAAGKLIKEANLSARRRILITTEGFDRQGNLAALESLLSALLAALAPLPKIKKDPEEVTAHDITILYSGTRPDFSQAIATHAGNHLARWLTTLPPNFLDCKAYTTTLRSLAHQMGWQFTFLDEPALKKLKAGAFLAVARANSHRNAGIVKLSYRPKGKLSTSVALVGKGICFDTGGINLKPHKSMYHMHEDMMGSAVAVGTLLALTQMQAPFAIDCWLALTENEIGANAYRPQEVVTAANGLTIQVAHSDAEGRMALADTLALASRDQPDMMMDFATLTGACVVALTERMSGVFTNRDAWRAELENAGKTSGERVWSFPMDDDFDSDLDSSIADILQCTPDSKGDHILAARFLSKFVGKDIGWVHVDLASANRSGGLAHIPSDCTGFGVRFAVEWLLNHRDARHAARDTSQ